METTGRLNRFLIKKGDAVAHLPGLVRVLATNNILELVGECSCTDWPLHYMVRLPNGEQMVFQHSEIEVVK